MPITPFHFGPGAAIHAIAPRYISLIAFCAANVLIDLEPLYNLIHHRQPVHAFFHTYIGATVAAIAVIAIFAALSKISAKFPLPNLLGWKQLTYTQVAIGAALGAYSHIALDSLMHRDLTPLAPFTSGNGLLGLVSLSVLHWSCLVAGLLGIAALCIRKALASGKRAA